MFNQDELLDYLRKAKSGDERAKNEIFRANEPLLKSIIRRFKNKGVEYDDLYQIASIGFLKAIKNFDEKFNVKFSTYTVPMVIGEIKRYMRDNGAIKVSRTLKILANKINRYIDEYSSNHGDSPSIEHLSEKFSISQEEVVIALDSSRMPLSIYDKFEDEEEGQELIDKIPYEDDEEITLNKIQFGAVSILRQPPFLIIVRITVKKRSNRCAYNNTVYNTQNDTNAKSDQGSLAC